MFTMPEAATTRALPPALAQAAADYWSAHLERHPVEATAIGDNRFGDRLADPSPEATAAALAELDALAARLDGIRDDGTWTADARLTRSALAEAIASDAAGLRTGLQDWNVDPMDGPPTSLLAIPDFQPLATPADGDAMVARWHAMGAFTDAYRANLERSLGNDLVACRAPAERVRAMLAELLAADDSTWPLLAPLADADGHAEAAGRAAMARWSPAERARFADGLRTAVAGSVRPAFARLLATLDERVLPAARPNEQPGMCHVEGGLAGYRSLVRVHTSLDLTPEELHATGLAEIDRIDRELADLAGRTLGTRTLPDALAALRADPALRFATRDEVRAKAESSLARANGAIADWFGRLPQAPCEVVVMGDLESEHSTIAFYREPAVDGSRPGQYYINTWKPETRTRYEAEVLAYHEAVPGHHLQIAIAQELAIEAEFRRHLGPTAFFEGWGLYTERLCDEMGLYTGDLDRIGVLSFDAWRASRLVVDTGMHALGWTRRQAIDFMLAHTALAENNIVNEVDRYIVLPGQALAYKTGQLELLRLRDEARAALGPRFDIRAFHDTVLGNGALALPVLRDVVATWVSQVAVA
jgi:uncharacterized protein (DUF885 family)